MSIRRRIVAATPMICLIIYLCFGFMGNIWHPSWVVFLAIPIVSTILNENFTRYIYPIMCLLAYALIGCIWDYWHPGWILFLTIPVYYTLFGPNLKRK
ncbi:MAG: hypothetical protein IJA65_04495 [Acholeplasmatales bacterium]|nr:hypothetical protein [Acholeplasmatales bacterium]